MKTLAQELRGLAEGATPGLLGGKLSAKALAGLLQTGAEMQRPQAQDFRRGEFAPEADAALITALLSNLPTILEALEGAEWRPMSPPMA